MARRKYGRKKRSFRRKRRKKSGYKLVKRGGIRL